MLDMWLKKSMEYEVHVHDPENGEQEQRNFLFKKITSKFCSKKKKKVHFAQEGISSI